MTLDEIKAAVLAGKTVHWISEIYVVTNVGDTWDVICTENQHCIGLTRQDGITLNCENPEDFYIKPEPLLPLLIWRITVEFSAGTEDVYLIHSSLPVVSQVTEHLIRYDGRHFTGFEIHLSPISATLLN